MKKISRKYVELILILFLSMGAFFYFLSKKNSTCPGEMCTIEWYPKNVLKEALKRKDPNICETTPGGRFQDIAVNKKDSAVICKADYAIKTKDVNLCLSLRKIDSYRYGRDNCIRELARILKKPELCDELTEKGSISGIQECKKRTQGWF